MSTTWVEQTQQPPGVIPFGQPGEISESGIFIEPYCPVPVEVPVDIEPELVEAGGGEEEEEIAFRDYYEPGLEESYEGIIRPIVPEGEEVEAATELKEESGLIKAGIATCCMLTENFEIVRVERNIKKSKTKLSILALASGAVARQEFFFEKTFRDV